MEIIQATREFETWLARQVDLQSDEVVYKHERMANADDPFPFFRGTYYRWAQMWPKVCPKLQAAPSVLSVGDLHIENFGTWRDSESRLVWGVNDFDEADILPFTNDLMRLAASVWFATRTNVLQFRFREACQAILNGYREGLASNGQVFVLEENHPSLRRLAMQEDRNPVAFWKKLTTQQEECASKVPEAAEAALRRSLPPMANSITIGRRLHVGMGSLGKPRFLALAKYAESWVAREAKALCGPATGWFEDSSFKPSSIAEVLSKAKRCPDPCFMIDGSWIVRRLAPRCSRIELAHLTKTDDEQTLLTAMGTETANIHLGGDTDREALLRSLESLPNDWLETAARETAKLLRDDWKTWCRSSPTTRPASRKGDTHPSNRD